MAALFALLRLPNQAVTSLGMTWCSPDPMPLPASVACLLLELVLPQQPAADCLRGPVKICGEPWCTLFEQRSFDCVFVRDK